MRAAFSAQTTCGGRTLSFAETPSSFAEQSAAAAFADIRFAYWGKRILWNLALNCYHFSRNIHSCQVINAEKSPGEFYPAFVQMENFLSLWGSNPSSLSDILFDKDVYENK